MDHDAARQTWDEFYREHGLNEIHQKVLAYLLTDPPWPAGEALRRLQGWNRIFRKPMASAEEYERAIGELIERGIGVVTNEQTLQEIQQYLTDEPAWGPTMALPDCGDLQATMTYVRLLDEPLRKVGVEPSGWSRMWLPPSQTRARVYCATAADYWNFLEVEMESPEWRENIVHISDPEPCGPWRSWWHNKKERGLVFEIQYR